jgi:hypothetical protein
MFVQQVTVSKGVDIVDLFEQTLAALGLEWRRLSLKKYPDGIHWHITYPGSKGTLEATYLSDGKQLWLEIHGGREAPWQAGAVSDIKTSLSLDESLRDLRKGDADVS